MIPTLPARLTVVRQADGSATKHGGQVTKCLPAVLRVFCVPCFSRDWRELPRRCHFESRISNCKSGIKDLGLRNPRVLQKN